MSEYWAAELDKDVFAAAMNNYNHVNAMVEMGMLEPRDAEQALHEIYRNTELQSFEPYEIDQLDKFSFIVGLSFACYWSTVAVQGT